MKRSLFKSIQHFQKSKIFFEPLKNYKIDDGFLDHIE